MTLRATRLVLAFIIVCAVQLALVIALAFQFIITVGIVGVVGFANVRLLGLLQVTGEILLTCGGLWLATFYRTRIDRAIESLNIAWL